MGTDIRVYLNEQALDLPAGATVRDAVSAALPELMAWSDGPAARVTDGRGIVLDLDLPLENGSIIRAARSARRDAS